VRKLELPFRYAATEAAQRSLDHAQHAPTIKKTTATDNSLRLCFGRRRCFVFNCCAPVVVKAADQMRKLATIQKPRYL